MVSGNGEVISEKNERFADALNDEGYRFPSHKIGARIFSDVKFPNNVTDTEIGKMTRLSKVMIGKTNMLGYRKYRDIIPYTIKEIGEIVGLCEERGRKFVNRMCKLRMMQEITTNSGKQYYINPAYFMASGQRLSLDLFLLFRNELTTILPKWVITSFLMQAQVKKV